MLQSTNELDYLDCLQIIALLLKIFFVQLQSLDLGELIAQL
jgi:hypothetical protein